MEYINQISIECYPPS